MASASSDPGEAPEAEKPTGSVTASASSAGSKAVPFGFAASWAAKLGQKASDFKAVTKEAMQQTKEAMQSTKEAFTAEAKMVAKDMADLKDGVAEGMRLTVQDTQQLRERIGQQTRKVFAKECPGAEAEGRSEAAAPSVGSEEDVKSEPKKGLFGPDTTEQLKGKVQDLKAGGKKAAGKVLDVGGKLWHKTDHWFHQLRGDVAKEGAVPAASWDECHQHALQLFGEPESGADLDLAWMLEELKMGALDAYAKSTVMFYHPSDKAMVDEIISRPTESMVHEETPRMAAYCRTPLRDSNQGCDVHLFSFSKSFLEVDTTTTMDDMKRTELREKLQWLCYTVSACASEHHLSIAWHLPGGAAQIPFLDGPIGEGTAEVSVEGLQELCKMMMKDQLKSFPEVDLATTRLPEISTLAGSPDTASTLFVTTAEPWRGTMQDQGVFGTCTALALLCRASTNPYGPKQVPLAPQEVPSKSKPSTAAIPVAATAATVAAAGVDLLDMGEEKNPPTVPEVVIGDDELLDEELSTSRTTQEPVTSTPVMSPPVANGSTGGYVATTTTQVSATNEDDVDWLDELADPDEFGPGAGPVVPATGQTAQTPADDKGIGDADFDALWDSMIDEVKPPDGEVANGAS